MSDAKPGDSATAEPKAESRQESDKQSLVNDRPVDAPSDHRQSSTNHGHRQQRAYGQPTASYGGNPAKWNFEPKFAPSSPSGLNPNAPAFKPRPHPPDEQLTFPGGYSDFNPVHATTAGPKAFTFPNGNDGIYYLTLFCNEIFRLSLIHTCFLLAYSYVNLNFMFCLISTTWKDSDFALSNFD